MNVASFSSWWMSLARCKEAASRQRPSPPRRSNRLRRPSPESVSHALALVFTIGVVAATVVREETPHETAMNNPAIQLELASDPAPPAPRVPDPPAPQPPKPRPVHKKEPAHQEVEPASLPLMADTAAVP